MTLSAGQAVGRYRVLSVVGSGGMATVYRVQHVELGTLFALKVLQIQSTSLGERLRKEGRAQGRLQHPNVLRVVDLVELPSGPGLILDLANGPALDDVLRDLVRPTLAQADFLMQQIARGVAAAHEQGIVHRDLKPGNVLLHLEIDRLLPKVADFGLAKVADDGAGPRTRTGATLGTPSYMSPEQVRDPRSAAPSSDVYALGVVAFELLTGRVPFEGPDLFDTFQQICTGARPSVRSLAPDVPAHLDALIERSLAIEVQGRPPDAAAFLAAWVAAPIPVDRGVGEREVAQLVAWVEGWLRHRPPEVAAEGSASTFTSDSVEGPRAPVAVPATRGFGVQRIVGALGALGLVAALSVVGLALAAGGAGMLYFRVPAAPDDELVVLPPLVGRPPVVAPPVAPTPTLEPAPAPVKIAGKATPPLPHPAEVPPDPAPDPASAPPPTPTAPVDLAACADLRLLETPASTGKLTADEVACLERRVDASADQTERDFTSRLLIRDAQVPMLAGGPCADFDRRITAHLEQISRSDAGLMYTWVTHLASRHPDRDKDLITWADRALEDKHQLGEGATFTDKVARLLQLRARSAADVWAAAQDDYLQHGRTAALEVVEEAQRGRARTMAREWLEFLASANRDQTEAHALCVTTSGSESCAVQ